MVTPEVLITELKRIGVNFVVGGNSQITQENLSPQELLAGQTQQFDARLRLAIIAVLLHHPEFARAVPEAIEILEGDDQQILMLYYTAAHLLRIIYRHQLLELLGAQPELPDIYSNKLQITTDAALTERLHEVAQKHQEVSGNVANWYGTYQHAAEIVIRRLEKERQWATV